MEANEKAKDSVFGDLFSFKSNILKLLLVLHPEMTDVTEDEIQRVTLRQVMVHHPYNDLSFVVRGRLIIFVEAQATWTMNILVRLLIYYAETVKDLLQQEERILYQRKKVPLLEPEFAVIYTGPKKDIPETISLSRDFFHREGSALDLTARVYHVETEDIIGQYIIFCHVFDEQVRIHGRTDLAVRETIRICMDRDVLREYLNSREMEAYDIMTVLFDQDYNDRIRIKNAVARAEARSAARTEFKMNVENIQRLMSTFHYDLNQAMDFYKIPEKDRPKYIRKLTKDTQPPRNGGV